MSAAELRKPAHQRAHRAARRFRLPFRRAAWRGPVGNWMGAGIGSSIDYQDHRDYMPGDDPRYIDWQACARTGRMVMKLYREEVAPGVDLVLDGSRSMRYLEDKQARSLEAFYFAALNARLLGASLKVWVTGPRGPRPVPPEEALGWDRDPFAESPPDTALPDLAAVPLRPGSMRVVVTDCLHREDPEPLTRALSQAKGVGLILAPAAPAEANPDWSDAVDLRDCEGGTGRTEHIARHTLERYREAYRRHFELWSVACRQRAVALAVLPTGPGLEETLLRHALPQGAVEPWT